MIWGNLLSKEDAPLALEGSHTKSLSPRCKSMVTTICDEQSIQSLREIILLIFLKDRIEWAFMIFWCPMIIFRLRFLALFLRGQKWKHATKTFKTQSKQPELDMRFDLIFKIVENSKEAAENSRNFDKRKRPK